MLFRRTATLLSASAMVLSACGADTGSSSAPCLVAPGGEGQSLTVTARDDRFDPECIDAARQGEITLVVRNDGRHPHNLTLESGDSVSVDSAQVAFITA